LENLRERGIRVFEGIKGGKKEREGAFSFG
jgi:hypothetical protein